MNREQQPPAVISSTGSASAGSEAECHLLFCASDDHPLASLLVEAFGAALTVAPDFARSSPPSPTPHLAFGAGPDFDAWTHLHQIPALTLDLSAGILGPLALPGQPACGHCARSRHSAARATAGPTDYDQSTPAPILPPRYADALLGELHALLTGRITNSRLIDHVLVFDPASAEPALRRFIPLPWCPICGGAATALPRKSAEPLSADTPAAGLLLQLEGWLDPQVGVISRIGIERTASPVTMRAAAPQLPADAGFRQFPMGWGKGLTPSAALLSTVGETIERYSASLPDPARMVWTRPADLNGPHLSPTAFALYSEEQYTRPGFPFTPYDPEVVHPWILGRLAYGPAVYVPAVFAYLSLSIRPEQNIAQSTSSGLAAGPTLEDAAHRAILELIERDAFLTTWYTGQPVRRIELDETLAPELYAIVDSLAAIGGGAEFYLLPSAAAATVVLALALGDGTHYPGATIGLGADPDPIAALRQAILELGQTGPHLRHLMLSGELSVPAGPEEVGDLLDHAAYYFPRERAAAFDRLRQAADSIPLAELPLLARPLDVSGLRIVIVDVTSPDVALGPFRVARAISPDLQPLSHGYGFDQEPVARLRALGLAPDVPLIHPIW